MRRAINIIGGLGLGLSLSQFPEFSQQYEQRLGGAVDELRIVISDFDDTAAREGLTRTEALERYSANGDSFIVERGVDMTTTFARYERLSAHLVTLQDANLLDQLTGLTQYYDPEIAASTMEAYEPAVPVTPEGLAFTGIGVLAGYGLLALVLSPFRRRRPSRRV